jgi:EmrB/QacA subfamily drug resistance transporter
MALLVLCGAEVLVAVDGMVVSVALPSVGSDLGFAGADLQWVVTAYTLALGSFLLVGGRLADRLGRRRTLLLGLGLFTAASLAAGAARAPAPLLAARAVAGFGGALAIPSALALVTVIFPGETERRRALGWVSASVDAGMVTGALLGGVVVSALGWPWVFFAVVPLGAAILAAAPAALDDDRPSRRARSFDAPGALLTAAGLAALIFGLTRAQRGGIGAPPALAAFAAAALLLALLTVNERRARDPLLSPALLSRRRAVAACLAIVANAGAFGGLVVLSTLLMQRELRFSALETGLGFVPLAVSAGAGGPLAAPLVARFGVRAVVVASLLTTAAALLMPVHRGGYAVTLLPAFAVSGFTFATAAVPLTAEAVADATPAERGAAAGLFQTCTHAGGAVVLAALVVAQTAAGYPTAFALAATLLAATAGLFSRPRPARPCPAGARARAGRPR